MFKDTFTDVEQETIYLEPDISDVTARVAFGGQQIRASIVSLVRLQ